MASFHWSIATDQNGSNSFTFDVNPKDVSGIFPERAYTAKPVLSGSHRLQFPSVDTRLRQIVWDIVPDENTAHRNFLLGDAEGDSGTILNLARLNSSGALTVYWLTIPTTYKHLRPEGYRDSLTIPIRVEQVHSEPLTSGGRVRWQVTMYFRLVPEAEVGYDFALDSSPLDSQHELVTSALTYVYYYDLSLDTYTDYTDEAYEGGSPFPPSIATGDILYFGCKDDFYGIKATMDTPETVVPDPEQEMAANIWQYWNGSAFTGATVEDWTQSFTRSDCVTWDGSGTSGWTKSSLPVAGAPTTDSVYWMKVWIGTVTTPFDFDTIVRA